MDGENEGGLSAVETAYFESGGEKPLTEEAPIQEQVQAKVETPPEKVEAKTEETAEQKAERERDEKTGRFVPHGALHAEREERKRIQAERDQLLADKAALAERWRIVQEQKAAQEKPEIPDEGDYVGTIEWLRREHLANQKQAAERDTQTRQQQEAHNQVVAIYNEVNTAYVEAEKADPTLTDAYNHTRQSMIQEYQLAGVPAHLIEPKLEEFAVRLAIMCKQNGYQPAEFVKNLAKARGWQPKAPEPKKDEVAERLAGIEKAQEQAKTIGQASGSASGDPDTLESILAMSKTEFEAWHAVPANARRFDKLMGA